ncbi:MAG: hypothetical protein JW864_18575 [Spirochaetes bacterium]|nr:hypothetical protein [Spirochaetota bacterium]
MKTKKKIKKRRVVPVGIFFILLIILGLFSAAVLSGYFYFEAKSRISDIEKAARDYLIPLAEASANLAELSYKNKNYFKLKQLFREKIEEEIIDEAFFVLSDGKIIIHSDREVEKDLKGNIATDEFAYNVDLIMLPVWSKTDNVQFMDYHIYDNDLKIPFRKDVTQLLKQYIYNKVDVPGWLVTRAVFHKEQGIGCVSFLVSKDRIYKFLLELFNNILNLSYIFAGISLGISFFISVVIFFRYSSLSKRRAGEIVEHEIESIIAPVYSMRKNGMNGRLKEAIKIKSTFNCKINNSDKSIIKDAVAVTDKKRKIV